ncbi:hypothetical protein NQ315_015758 [Exocentrus adspersus]|uniref:Uncharacterized protein n=1 Tax=Exocentrus adspersus TaxID=1586481 RepID=A0AAV8W397_9CUCU|nr:hypothetical protein NQ315_015758 [Exocentrus adspersus]
MEIDFDTICRVCLNAGVMMSIFKVNISKKMMACASVQVWPNDGLPTQICNKCSAKLHISFQFKKQCEKSDAKLRQMLASISLSQEEVEAQKRQQQQQHEMQQLPEPQQMDKLDPLSITSQLAQATQQGNCVYIECPPMMEQLSQDQNTFIPVAQNQTPLSQINYNIQQNHLQLGYNIQSVGQVQVYNGTYAMPLQTMQAGNMLHNQIVPQMQLQPQQQITTLQPIVQQTLPVAVNSGDKDTKKPIKLETKKDPKGAETGKQCPTCNKIFATATKLSRHMKIHSTDLPYKCKMCNKSFSHSGNFKIHLRMHTDERPFRCTVCDRGCRQAQDLEKHMRTHTGEKPHKCHICPRAFSTSSNLIAHIRTHTGERPYVCCVCQKAFCQSNELTKHMRTHTGEKSHICDICNKGFNGSSTLIVHRRSHTGERPYICIICSKGFAQSSCLAVHMKRHNNEKLYPCIKCERSFVTNSELTEHHSSHLDDKQYSCTACSKKFGKLADFNKHLKTHSTLEES